MRKILHRLREVGLYSKLKKCEFSTKRMRFLGFIITPEGISMEEEWVTVIKD